MDHGQVSHQADEALDHTGTGATDEERAFETFVAEGAQTTLEGMMQLIIASPQSAPLVLDLLDRARDWPMAAEIAQQIRGMLKPETPAEQGQGFEPLAMQEAPPAPEEAAPVDHIRETAVAADTAASLAAREAGRQVVAQTYESHRILAVAAIETMMAHAQLALAALKWEAENVPAVAGYLIQADRQLKIASHAVAARLELADMEGRVMANRGETAPAAA